MNRDFKGVWIPKEIWMNEDLTWMEKLFFVEIDSLDNESGCTASNNYFADFFFITPQRASQVINTLIKKEYLKARYEYNGKEVKLRVLNIFNRGIKYSKLGIKNSLKGYQEKFKDNNIYNNTDNNTVDVYWECSYFKITVEQHNKFKKAYPSINIDQEYSKMEIWLDSNPLKRKTEKGYPRFINSWLNKTKESKSDKSIDNLYRNNEII